MLYLDEEPYHVDVELINLFCKCSKMLERSGIEKFSVVDVRGVEKGSTRHLISISTDQTQNIPVDEVRIEREDKIRGNSLICFESDGCAVCNTIISRGSFLLSGSNIDGPKFVYSFIAPNYDVFRQIITSLEESGFEINVLKVEKYQPQGKVLTEKQEKLLWFAYKMGFFEYPRKIHMKELSERLGMSMSSFSETTRRGIRNLLKAHF